MTLAVRLDGLEVDAEGLQYTSVDPGGFETRSPVSSQTE